jgi:phospholipid/cholesterol/gamma-HCH transport system substrate-binding protein
MNDDRINYVLVGVFVLGMLAALLTSIAVLTGRTGAADTYFTRYEDATGLKYGSRVLYMGYPVGQVADIRPAVEEGRLGFEVVLALDKSFASWGVPADSVAQVRAAGLLAAVAIDIRTGRSEQALRPGDRIRGVARSDVFAALSATAGTVRDLTEQSIKPLVENLNRYVSVFGEVLERRGVPLVDDLSVLSRELAYRAPAVIDEFLATAQGLRAVGARLEVVLSDENAGKLGGVVDNVLAASGDMARLSATARTQVERLLSDTLLLQVESVARNVEAAAGDLATTGRRAREGVDALLSTDNLDHVQGALAHADAAAAGLRSMTGPEQQRKVTATLDGVSEAASGLDALVADTGVQIRALLGPQTVKRVDRALANISEAAANLARLSAHLDDRVDRVLTPEMADKLRQTLENFSLAAANVATLSASLNDSRKDLDALLAALRGIAEDNRSDLRSSVEDLRRTLGVVAQHIDAVAYGLEGTSRNMVEFSRRLKANPGLLLRGTSPVDGVTGVPGGG